MKQGADQKNSSAKHLRLSQLIDEDDALLNVFQRPFKESPEAQEQAAEEALKRLQIESGLTPEFFQLSRDELEVVQAEEVKTPRSEKSTAAVDPIFYQGKRAPSLSLLATFKQKMKRVTFHLKAAGCSFLLGLFSNLLPASALPVNAGAVSVLSYFGLVLLFPSRPNPFATLVGFVVAALVSLFGFWPVGLALGGIVTILIQLLQHRKFVAAHFTALPLILAGLASVTGEPGVALLPAWIYGVMGVGILLGVGKAYLLPSIDLKKIAKKEQPSVEEQKQSAHKDHDPYEVHYEQLRKIEAALSDLPQNMHVSVRKIGRFSLAIIKCMQEDPRDVEPGNRFLNRYLPMLNQSLSDFSRLQQHQVSSDEYEKMRALTEETLERIGEAFSQMYEYLLNNDLDDITINLKVMDRLLRTEGFEVEKK